MCRSSTNATKRTDAALTGLCNGEHTLRTRRRHVEQRSVRCTSKKDASYVTAWAKAYTTCTHTNSLRGLSPTTRVNFAAFFVVQIVICTIVCVTLAGDHEAMCKSSTNAKKGADAALTGLCNGKHTLRTRRRYVQQRSVRQTSKRTKVT